MNNLIHINYGQKAVSYNKRLMRSIDNAIIQNEIMESIAGQAEQPYDVNDTYHRLGGAYGHMVQCFAI